MGTGFHVLLLCSCSSSLLGQGQNRSKPSCVQPPVGKGNVELEKRNKSRGASSLLWELARLCCPVLLQLRIPSWHPSCPRSSASTRLDRADTAPSQPCKSPCKHRSGSPELVC